MGNATLGPRSVSHHTLLLGLVCVSLLLGCEPTQQSPLTETSSPIRQTPTSPTYPSPTSKWQVIRPGVAWQSRLVQINSIPRTVVLVRLQPSKVRMRVAYDPQQPKSVGDWFRRRRPLIAINGGYFEASYTATALTIADGVVSGYSYEGFGGMLTMDRAGHLELRSLVDQPYDSSEDLVQAIQSTPRLVWNGKAVQLRQDDDQRARRTVVAMDRADHLLLIVCNEPTWTLRELSHWLATTDLAIDRALNLDGGPSTGLAIQTAPSPFLLESGTVLPQVILIEGR